MDENKKAFGNKIITIPNIITMLRLVCTIFLLILSPHTPEFYILYTLSGLSDVLDGVVARVTKSISEFGAKLDSIADLVFYFVMLAKMFHILLEKLMLYVWIFISVISALRLGLYFYVAIKKHKLISNHTTLNKITGFLIFLVPFLIHTKIFPVFSIVTCSVAFIAVIEEIISPKIKKI